MEMEMEMEMGEKPWKVVNRRRRRRRMKENQQQLRRPWDALPSLALSNIFIKLDLKDRCCSIPFVCKAWNSVISGDPLCWSSMIPESVSPDDAFIKNPADYYSLQIYPLSSYHKLHGYRRGWEDYYPLVIRGGKWDGISRFRTLLKKASWPSTSSSSAASSSSSSSSSTITSLYLTPFTYSYPDNEESLDQDEILHLIANCCPNLKHISFDGFCHASKGAMFEVFHRCNKLELIDFSESLGDTDTDSFIQVIKELGGNNLPHLRGIRTLKGCQGSEVHTPFLNAIATHLPRIKLLDIECDAFLVPRLLLLSSQTQLLQLQYLRVGVYLANQLPPPPLLSTTHIPEFHYEDIDYLCEPYSRYYPEFDYEDEEFDYEEVIHHLIRQCSRYCQCSPRHRRPGSSHSLLCHFCTKIETCKKREKEKEDLLSEYSSHPAPQDYSTLKQNKEDEYYVPILKENKKTRNHHRHRHALMRRRGLMKKKNNKDSSLKIMKKKNTDNHMYDYYAEDHMYLVH